MAESTAKCFEQFPHFFFLIYNRHVSVAERVTVGYIETSLYLSENKNCLNIMFLKIICVKG